MDIKVINFDPSKGDLKVNLIFNGVFIGTYGYELWDSSCTSVVDSKIGHNFSAGSDCYSLPFPVNLNNGRYIRVGTEIKPQNVGDDYSITLQVVQNGTLLGEVTDSGSMSTPALTSIIWARLKSI